MSPFAEVLAELQAMHDRKSQDYGRTGDPFANVRASADFGVPAWVGALIRGHDKMRRLQRVAGGVALVNESVEDSLIDLAVYSIIALILFRESRDQPSAMHSIFCRCGERPSPAPGVHSCYDGHDCAADRTG